MKVNYPGLLIERLPSGKLRHRVRALGNLNNRIRIYCGPEHPLFQEQYLAARAGIQPEMIKDAQEDIGIKGTLGWLLLKYMAYFEKQVENGANSAKTLKKKRNLFTRLTKHADKNMNVPPRHLIKIQDQMSDVPAQADALIEAMGVMFKWAIKRGYMASNPAENIDRIYKKGAGAKSWTKDDLKKYFKYHKSGTKANAALHILLWTGCRIEDLTALGRRHECIINGSEALRFQPLKKGSSEVCVPFVAQLKNSVRSLKVQGNTYILGRAGKPYSTGDSMSATFIKWCNDAGLKGLSAHGVRKALAELLAEIGCSQHQIMAVLGHSEARTSEIYTRNVNRWKLSEKAMEKVKLSHGWL